MIRLPGALTRRSERFRFARQWVDLSGVLDLLDAEPRAEGGRGRPAVHPPYDARGLLICLAELGLDRKALTYAAMQEALFFVYSDSDMDMLGMGSLRTHENYRLFASDVGFEHDDDKNETTVTYKSTYARRAWASENERLRRAFERALTPIDDNYMSKSTATIEDEETGVKKPKYAGNRKRYTNAELAKERRKQGVLPQTAVRNEAMNRLIVGSVYALNAQAYPKLEPTDLYNGVLRDHVHDYAIDETDFLTASSATSGVAPDKLHARCELAGPRKKHRHNVYPEKVGLTLLCTVSRPLRPRVPTLTVAASLSQPSAASLAATRAVLEFLGDSGLRDKPKGRAHQYVVGDMAYPNLNGYAAMLSELQFSPVMKYPKNRTRVHVLRTAETALLSDAHLKSAKGYPVPGHLANGCVVCPGVSRQVLVDLAPGVPKPVEGKEGVLEVTDLGMPRYRPDELVKHAEDTAWLEPFEMVTHGRPEIGPLRKGGRPRKDAPPAPTANRQTFVCPATAEKARCPHVLESMSRTDLPLVPSPPPADHLPPTCQQTYTTFVFSKKQFKQVQPMRVGTWEHSDMYESARARNEWFNSVLRSEHGGRMTARRIEATKNAFLTVALAITVGTANYYSMSSWTQELLRHYGDAPPEPHLKKQASRDRQVTAARGKPTAA